MIKTKGLLRFDGPPLVGPESKEITMTDLVKHSPLPWVSLRGATRTAIYGNGSIHTHGRERNASGISSASYSDVVCEILGNTSLPGPAANRDLILESVNSRPGLLAEIAELKEQRDGLLQACQRIDRIHRSIEDGSVAYSPMLIDATRDAARSAIDATPKPEKPASPPAQAATSVDGGSPPTRPGAVIDAALLAQAQACPFCGSLWLELHRDFDFVWCKECGGRGPHKDQHPLDAVQDWNHRKAISDEVTP